MSAEAVSSDVLNGFAPGVIDDDALEIIAATNWPKFGLELTIAIARAWEGGGLCVDIARAVGCAPGSISMTIGKLRQIGVQMRIATGQASHVRREPRVDVGAAGWAQGCGAPQRVIDVRRDARGDVTRQLLGDPPPGRTPWSAP